MTEAFLVIDGYRGTPPDFDDAGLRHAPAYYAAFPQEPSPLGLLTLTPAKTTVMLANNSLFVALAEMAKAGSGGAALLVCHAFPHRTGQAGGLGLPIAPGGKTVFATTESMDSIDKLVDFEAAHDRIRAMPQTGGSEQKAVLAAWRTFFSSLPGAPAVGEVFTDAEAEKVYQQWFTQQANRNEFRGAADFRELLKRVKALRSAKLDRIELRACEIGGDATTMDRVRKFFGCNKLTAPTVGTIFGLVAVGPLVAATPPRGSHAPTIPSRPLRHTDLPESFESTLLTAESKTTRGFIPFSHTRFAMERPQVLPRTSLHLGAIESYGGFRFVLRIVQTRPYHYKPAAWAAGSAKAPAPDPDIVQQFCVHAFKSDTKFHSTTLPHAGLWTPDKPNQPFVLPLEREYLPLIAQSPAPAAKSGAP